MNILQYQSQDVGTIDGATLLLKRIAAAAAKVCAPLDQGSVASRSNRIACEARLTASAVAQVNRPTLQLVYASSPRPRLATLQLAAMTR